MRLKVGDKVMFLEGVTDVNIPSREIGMKGTLLEESYGYNWVVRMDVSKSTWSANEVDMIKCY